jgi:O-antigen/teichoic acid export membrane protein
VVLGAGCIPLWIGGERLLDFAFGAEFIAANPIFRLLALEAAFGVLSQITVQLFLASNRPGFISVVQAVMLTLSLCALMLVTPMYGALGAAAVLAAVGLLRFLTLLFAATRVLGHAPPRLWLNIEDLRFIARRIP